MKGLTTQTKLRIARILSRTIIGLRKCLAKPAVAHFRRNGIDWELDLNEGIDLAIYLFGRFEYDVYKAYRKSIHEGSVVLDIGANIGAHTLPMAQLAGSSGRVYAFEPTVFAISKLRTNLSLNPEIEKHVTVHHSLLSDSTNSSEIDTTIPSSWDLSAASADTHPQHGGSFMEIGDAKVCTLDEIVDAEGIQKVDLIKLDVDGNEWPILKGSATTFDRYKPDVLMEFAPDYNLSDFRAMLEFFKDRSYVIHNTISNKQLPSDLDELKRHIPKDGSINVRLSKVD